MRPARWRDLCWILWISVHPAGLVVSGTRSSTHQHFGRSETCAAYEALYPTIYEQLVPFLGGVKQSQVDLAKRLYQTTWPPPKLAEHKFNLTAAQTLAPDDPAFPWYQCSLPPCFLWTFLSTVLDGGGCKCCFCRSHPYLVKVTVKDGELWLPGGRIPPVRDGYAFTFQW